MLSREEIIKLAELSRLALSEEEMAVLAKDLNSIVGYISVLQKLDIKDEGEQTVPYSTLKNIMREDINPHDSGEFTEDILNEAPRREGNYIAVKPIFEGKR
ncbi:MAG: Asp-tRNA(Asn)/Glu-tRNA(Gln) amidotransferase subunit GatC [Candidatus Vogelbacteria bacterium]|nr:Asp-tRNA(Asn)/Glu-tRNA(Gln) amidotransferase subunit GatC [Candidatus Vogelbacteria bacterium]